MITQTRIFPKGCIDELKTHSVNITKRIVLTEKISQEEANNIFFHLDWYKTRKNAEKILRYLI